MKTDEPWNHELLIVEVGDGYMGVHYIILTTLYMFGIFYNET